MESLQKDFREFIELLNANEVRYLIVGGFAVAFHGYPRFTGDIDLFVEPTTENAARVAKVFEEFGMGSLGLSERDFLAPSAIVQVGYPPYRIDVLMSISGCDFASAWDSRVDDLLDGVPVHFLGKEQLIANKATVQREKDMADLQALRKRRV